jgi:hypothetical protein
MVADQTVHQESNRRIGSRYKFHSPSRRHGRKQYNHLDLLQILDARS